jgi:hypothetical protein
MFFSEASLIMISSFSILTYTGSLYLQKNTCAHHHPCTSQRQQLHGRGQGRLCGAPPAMHALLPSCSRVVGT